MRGARAVKVAAYVVHAEVVGTVKADLGGFPMAAVLRAGPTLSSGHTYN